MKDGQVDSSTYNATVYSGILLGVILGVLLNILLPEILILIFLVCVLSFSAFKTLRKGYAKWCEESKKMKEGPSGAVELGEVNVEVGAADVAPSLSVAGNSIETPYGSGKILEYREDDDVLVVSLSYGTAYLNPKGSPEAKAAIESTLSENVSGKYTVVFENIQLLPQ